MTSRQGKFLLAAVTTCLLGACGAMGGKKNRDPILDAVPNPIERSANPSAVSQHLDAIARLLTLDAEQQAEMLDSARRDAEASRLAGARLRHALLLATAGHAGYDPVAATVILKDVLEVPATLPPPERALAQVELQRIAKNAELSVENKRLREQLERAEREQIAALNRRLQAESDENARLRKALEEALAKLDKIRKIETGGR